MNQELQALQLNEELLIKKQENINKIATGIHEISELFQDMSIFVSLQANHLDNIETNITNTSNNIDKSNIELKKAKKYNLKKNKCFVYISCIIGLVLIIIIIIIIIIS